MLKILIHIFLIINHVIQIKGQMKYRILTTKQEPNPLINSAYLTFAFLYTV